MNSVNNQSDTVLTAAVYLHCHTNSVYHYARIGVLPHVRDAGGRIIFARDDLRAFRQHRRRLEALRHRAARKQHNLSARAGHLLEVQ